MIDKFCELLEGVKPTIISGVFLAASLILSLCGIDSPVDPAWVSLVISGIPLVRNAVWKILNLNGISKISSALLISIAMLAAIIIGDLFAAAEVAFIMAIGEILEDKTTERARKGLKNLISLAPTQGRRICGNTEEMIPAEEIRCGDILRILPGETIPVDGEITSGETSIDQSIMTGESLPVDKTVGDSVFCGTINRFGAVDIRATKVGEDSSLQRLIAVILFCCKIARYPAKKGTKPQRSLGRHGIPQSKPCITYALLAVPRVIEDVAGNGFDCRTVAFFKLCNRLIRALKEQVDYF